VFASPLFVFYIESSIHKVCFYYSEDCHLAEQAGLTEMSQQVLAIAITKQNNTKSSSNREC